jgi:hypothetical protein
MRVVICYSQYPIEQGGLRLGCQDCPPGKVVVITRDVTAFSLIGTFMQFQWRTDRCDLCKPGRFQISTGQLHCISKSAPPTAAPTTEGGLDCVLAYSNVFASSSPCSVQCDSKNVSLLSKTKQMVVNCQALVETLVTTCTGKGALNLHFLNLLTACFCILRSNT